LIEVVFSNDFHAAFKRGLSALAAMLAAKDRGAIVLDGGDFLGEAFFTHYRGTRSAEALQDLLFDALCPGNHGFEESCRSPRAVCCNLWSDGRQLCAPYRLLDRQGARVAVTAVLGEEAFGAIAVGHRRGLSVTPPAVELAALVPRLRAMSDCLIVISHSGFAEDEKLAGAVPELGFVLSGHCHSARFFSSISGTAIAKAPEYGAGYGRALLDTRGRIDVSIFSTAEYDGAAIDHPQLRAIRADLAELETEADRSLGRHDPRFYSLVENRDAYVSALAIALSASCEGARLAVGRYGFRILPKQPQLRVEALYDLFPFENRLVRVGLTDQVTAALREIEHHPDYLVVAAAATPPPFLVTTDYLALNVLGLSEQALQPFETMRDRLGSILVGA
jgi:5'-nucleotidase/UDP-sugar diphosphatase